MKNYLKILIGRIVLVWRIILTYENWLSVLIWFLFSSNDNKRVILRNGLVFDLKAKEEFGILNEVYAVNCYGLLVKKIKNTSVVVDIGANIGTFSVLAARKSRILIAVEPEKKNFGHLSRNIMQNSLRNVILVNAAVSKKDGADYLFLNGDSSHSLYHKISSKKIRVKVKTLNTIMRENGIDRIDCLKMDCEGAELDILHHCPLKKIDNIMMEVHVNMYTKNHKGVDELIGLLESNHFKVSHSEPYLYAQKIKSKK
ncbi:MAG: FkbM family methyltransferase [Candidatus Woesearchaeota archaeon]